MIKSEKPDLVFATNNRHKFEEIKSILEAKVNLLNLTDIGCHVDIPEEQNTLEGNAAQKALFVYHQYKIDCFADDTGLEIDALQGDPGVFSARFAGDKCSFEDNMNLVLKKMTGKRNRKARFRTIIALVEQGLLTTFEGRVEGSITVEKHGGKGFGYDPIFKPEGYDRTFAEMTLAEKNAISHRAIAIKAFSGYFFTGQRKEP